jgi:hypothetical protein
VIVVGRWQRELREDRRDVLLHRAVTDRESARDRAVRTAFGHQLEDVPLARRECVQRVAATPREQLGDDLGVEHRPTGGNPLQRVAEIGEGGDAVLEQVADAAAPVGEQVGRVRLLDVLRQHQDTRLGHLAADG